MKSQTKEKLLSIFSRLPDESELKPQIEAAFESSIEEITSSNAEFNKLFYYLSDNNKVVKEIISIESGAGRQISKYLEYLSSFGREGSQFKQGKQNIARTSLFRRHSKNLGLLELCHEVVTYHGGRLSELWGSRYMDYYKIGYQMLTEWNYFFFSYTTRGVDLTNQIFRSLLHELPVEKNTQKKTHLLAELIYNMICRKLHLTSREKETFYDKDRLMVSDPMKNTLIEQCKKSFTLVQLIEDDSFYGDPEENSCYLEYRSFFLPLGDSLVGELNKRAIFINIILEELPFIESYSDWIEDITNHKRLDIQSTESFPDLYSKSVHIADQVKKNTLTVFQSYLGYVEAA